ncbi:MAG: hypothetical protein ACK5MI_08530 [Mangrovibacterium sp.]
MKVEFKNHLTLRTVPSKMTKIELICSVFTWLLVLGFMAIVFVVFADKGTNALFVQTMVTWTTVLAAAVVASFVIDIKQRIVNPGSILWLAFLIYILINVIEKL